ncbi:sugar transferase [Haemophilus haemoglobinophilus]|nr:sugar transferase [Canicola haemoglobinophilus]
MKRHSRWYERLFFSTTFESILGIILTVFFPAWIMWEKDIFLISTRENTIIMTSLIFILITLSFRFLMTYPGEKKVGFVISIVISWYSVLMIILLVLRLDYSVVLLGIHVSLTLIFFFTAYLLSRKWITPKIAVVPMGRAIDLVSIKRVDWVILNSPSLDQRRYNAIVVDLYAKELNKEWQKFLAKCTLQGIPVYSATQLEESLTGRVKIHHVHENDLGSLLPSPIYSLIKRFIDLFLVLLSLPITLPIMVITAIAISLESPGGALFIQNRVGQGGKEFRIYKFRSMCKDSEKEGAQFALAGDSRVTRIGKFIRKTRIDELPQFFNVLKGDMSLIGPRPEQKVFVDIFEESIPFYDYRHIVKPGISGWAQVVHGYAADVDDTQVKIEHDFYYIKNFSFWLDIFIIFKTLKTMLTGFGAR